MSLERMKMKSNCIKYKTGAHQNNLSLINNLAAFSTNIDAMDIINNGDINEEWDISTSNIDIK